MLRAQSMKEEIRKAATAVVVRDTDQGLEVLLLRRHQQLKVGGGHWVFPGGTIDAEDFSAATDDEHAARLAATRETCEEANITLDAEQLLPLSHWTTPPEMGRRFATWFFLTSVGEVGVEVDGEEMDDYQWASPHAFILAHREQKLALLPPTLVTLSELVHSDSVEEARHFFLNREVPYFEPKVKKHLGAVCMLYSGDAGYAAGDPSILGARNRCYLEEGVWRYEYLAG